MNVLPDFVFDANKCNEIIYLRTFEVKNYAPTHFDSIVKHLMLKGNGVILETYGNVLPFNATKLELENSMGPWPHQIKITSAFRHLEDTPEWDMLVRGWDIALISFTNSTIQIYVDTFDYDLCLIAYSIQDKDDVISSINRLYYSNRIKNFRGLLQDINLYFKDINPEEFRQKLETNYAHLII